MLEIFENQRTGPFADHEPVSIGIKGTHRALRISVSRGRRVHHVEERRLDRMIFLGAAGDHDSLLPG